MKKNISRLRKVNSDGKDLRHSKQTILVYYLLYNMHTQKSNNDTMTSCLLR